MPIVQIQKRMLISLAQVAKDIYLHDGDHILIEQFYCRKPRRRSLHMHKTQGTEFFEAYVNMNVRIIFKRTGDSIILHAIGHHDILRRKQPEGRDPSGCHQEK